MMSTLRSFLADGTLGEVALGDTEAAVRDRLGEPEDVSVIFKPRTLKYGPLELAFLREPSDDGPHLTSMHLYFRRPGRLPWATAPDGWWPSAETSPEEFHRRLDELAIPVTAESGFPPSRHLMLDGGRVTFLDGRLHSIHRSSRKETRQVTVVLRKEEMDVIGRLAKESNVTASALCSRWIREHVHADQRVGSH